MLVIGFVQNFDNFSKLYCAQTYCGRRLWLYQWHNLGGNIGWSEGKHANDKKLADSKEKVPWGKFPEVKVNRIRTNNVKK